MGLKQRCRFRMRYAAPAYYRSVVIILDHARGFSVNLTLFGR